MDGKRTKSDKGGGGGPICAQAQAYFALYPRPNMDGKSPWPRMKEELRGGWCCDVANRRDAFHQIRAAGWAREGGPMTRAVKAVFSRRRSVLGRE